MLDIKPLESGDWKYELLVGECFHGCLHYGWNCQKIMQFGIFVFEEVHEINIRDNLPGNKCDGDFQHHITSVNHLQLY